MLFHARSIAQDIRNAGFDCRIVGGAVRDILCGMQPKDIDLVTTAFPDELEEIFPDIRWAGRAFGVSLLKRGNYTFELATARLERSYMDGRHPQEIKFSRDFQSDVIRRDFTVNALLCDPFTMEITDFVGGIEDVKRKIIRTVGDPMVRFQEDALRMLRAIRFSARRGFTLEEQTRSAIAELAGNVRLLAGERIKSELDKIIVSPGRRGAFEVMRKTGLLKELLPEVDALYGVPQEKQFHPEGDVYTHTMLMLEHMALPDTRLAWSALLHDIGKAVTTFTDENNRIRAFGHEEKGAEMVYDIAMRLKFSVDERNAVTAAVRNHMRMAHVREMKSAKLKRWMCDENFPLELELHRLDCISSHKFMECWLFLIDRLAETPVEVLRMKPLVNGSDLIKLGATPSPLFKSILDALFDRQLTGEFSGKEEALRAAKQMLEQKK